MSFWPASQKTLRQINDNPFQKFHLCHFCPNLKKRSEKLLTIHFKSLIFVVFARISKNAQKNYWQSISKVSSLSFLKFTDNPFQKSHLCRFCPHAPLTIHSQKNAQKAQKDYWQSISKVSSLSFLPASQKTLKKITDNPFQKSHLCQKSFCRFCPHLKKQKNLKKSLSFLPASQKTLRKINDNPFQKSHLCCFCPFLPASQKTDNPFQKSENAQKKYYPFQRSHLWQSISKVSSLSFLPASQKKLRKNTDNPKNAQKSQKILLTIHFKSLIFVVFARILTIHFVSSLSFLPASQKTLRKIYWQSISKVSSLSFLPASQKTLRKITDNPFQKSHLCRFCPHLQKRSERLLTPFQKSHLCRFCPHLKKRSKITDNPFQKSHLCRFCPHLKKRSEKLLTIHFKSLIFVVFARISKNAQKNYWQSISKVSFCRFCPHLKKCSEKLLTIHQKTLKITDIPFQKSHLCRFCPHLKNRSKNLLTIHFKSLIFVVFARISKNAQKNYWQSISKVSSLSFLPASQKTLRKITDNPFQNLILVVFARISKNAQKNNWQPFSKVSICRLCPHLKKRSGKLLTIHFKGLILPFLPSSQKTLRKITDNPFQKSNLCRFCPHLKKRSEKLLTIHFKGLIFVVFARISRNAQKKYWQSISKVSSLSFLPASQKKLRKITDNPFQKSHLCRFCPHLKKRSEKLLTIHFKSLTLSFLPASQKTLRKITDNPFQKSHLCRFCPHLKKLSEKLLTIHFKSLIFVVFVHISKNALKNYWQTISKVSSLSFLPASQKTLRKNTDNPFQKSQFVVFARISKNAQNNYWQSISKVSSSSFLSTSRKTLRKITDKPFQRSHLCRFCPHLKKRSGKLLTIHFKSLNLPFLPASQKTLRTITDNPFQRSHLCRFYPHLEKRSEKLLTINFKGLIFVVFARISKNNERNYWQSNSKVSFCRFCPHLKKRSEQLLTIHFKGLIFVVFTRISKNAQKNYWQSISKVSSLSFLPASQKTMREITDNPIQKSHFVVFARISKNAQNNYWQSISKVSSLSFLPASRKTMRKITDNPFQRSHLFRFCPHLKKRSEKSLTIDFKSLIFVVFTRISKNAHTNYWQSISKVSSLSFLPASQKTLRKITDNPFQRSHLCRFCPHLKKRSEKLLTIHFKSLIFVVFDRISKNAQKNYWQSISKVSSLSFLPASQKTLRKITDNPFQKSHLCGFRPHLKKRSHKLLTIHFKSLIFVIFARISKNNEKNYWQSISNVSSLSFLPASQKTLRKITDNPFQKTHLCGFWPHLKKRSEKLLTIHFKSLIFVVFARISKNDQKNYDNPFQKPHLCRFCPHLKKRSEKLLTIYFKSLIFVVFTRISKNDQKNYWQSISKVSFLSFLPASQKTMRKITDNPFQTSHLCRFCPHLKNRSEKLLKIHFKSLIFVVLARISKNAQKNFWQSISKVSSLSFLNASQKTLRKITDNPFQRSHLCRFCPHLKRRSEKLLTIPFKGLVFVVFARISKNNERNYWQSISKVSSLSFLPASQKKLRKNYWQSISKVSSLSFWPASQKTLRKINDNPFQNFYLCRFCPNLKKRSEKLLTIHFKSLVFVVFARISKNAQKNYWQSISKVSSLSFLPASQKTMREITDNPIQKSHFVVFARISKNAQNNYWQSISKVSSLSFLTASQKTMRKITDNPFQRSHLFRFCPHLKKRSEKLLTIHFKSLIFVVFARISKNAHTNYWQSISKVSSLSFLPASQKTLRKITDNPFQRSHLCRFCPHLKKRSEKLLTIHFDGLIFVIFARISKNNEKNYWQSISNASSLSFLPASQKTLRKITDNPFQKSHLCGFWPHLKKRSEKLLTIHFKSLIFVVFDRISKNAQKNYWQSISKVSSLSFLPVSQKTLRKITDNPFQKSHLCRFYPHLKKRSEKLLTIHFDGLIFVIFARISKNNEKNYWQSISNASSLSFLPASQKTLRKITDNPFQKSHLCGFWPHLKKRSEKLLTIHFKSLIFVVFDRISKNAQKNYWQSISKVSSLSFLPVSQKTLRKITDSPFQKSHLCRFYPHLKKRSEKLLTIHFNGLIFVVFARISKNNEGNYWQSFSKVSSLSFLPASHKKFRKNTDNPFQKSHLCRFGPHLKKRSEKLLTIHFKSLIFVVFARISKNAQKKYWQSISKVSSLSFLPESQKTLKKNTDNPFQKSHRCRFCPHLKKRSGKLLTIHFKSLIFVVLARISKNAQKN